MTLNGISRFIIFHQNRVSFLTKEVFNSKKCFFPVTVQKTQFRGKNLLFYSEAFDKNTRADIFLQKMEMS
jgi:hypothetical protein